jgi:hypothetical protein
MDCKKAQRLFDDLSEDRLAPELAAQVRRHVTECTDCRVLQQRGARLQRLLALKRYERPGPRYFDSFLMEFHRALLAETQPRTDWWRRVDEFWSIGRVLVWRYGFATTMGIALAVGLMWMGLREMGDPSNQIASVSAPLTMTPIPETGLAAGPLELPTGPRAVVVNYESPTVENELAPTVVTRPEPAMPQYVLDRISATPASYEVARVYF